MLSFLSVLIIAFLLWPLFSFVAAYRRGKLETTERKAEREQKKDWARRMRGGSE